MSTRPEDQSIRVGGRYRLDERIGAGAMGAVWRGTDMLLNRTVAIKELLAAAAPHTAEGGDALEESRQRIMREGRIGARLQHPHVISMFDVVVHDDRPWLVMEYLPSKSLAQILAEKGPLSPTEVADIGAKVAAGLAAAHNAGVVHRDVKPGNVLIGEDGRVKLTDFGVSRAVDDVQLTRTGLIAGTPAFLAPEIARGGGPTAASDIFALGATLYAAVEGEPPFGLNANAYALLHKVATGEVRPPREAGPLTGEIMKLLRKEPEERPSATQARDALAAIAAGRSGTGTAVFEMPRTDPGPPTGHFVPAEVTTPARAPEVRRGRTPVLIGVLAVLVVGGVLAAVLLANRPTAGTGGQPTSPPPAAAATPTPTRAAPTTTPTTAPTTASTTVSTAAPAGDPVAFVQNYYALLPGNTDAAFAMLGPDARAASGGRDGFDNFYGSLESVSVRDVEKTGENSASATVVFVKQGGATSTERYRFVIGTNDEGRPIMESFSR
jgi:eukaryotic-like serine/threonine-protein kinase